VGRLCSPLAFVLEEGRLVDEQVGADGRFEDGPRRRRVARDHDRPPGPRIAEHLLGPHPGAVPERDRLAALERAALGPEGHAERIRSLDVEAPGRSSSISA
jgi:hypothetical protein